MASIFDKDIRGTTRLGSAGAVEAIVSPSAGDKSPTQYTHPSMPGFSGRIRIFGDHSPPPIGSISLGAGSLLP